MKRKQVFWVVLVGLILIWLVVPFYSDLLWFDQLGFSSVFWKILFTKLGVASAVWLIFVLIMVLNVYVANRLHPGNISGGFFRRETGYPSPLPLSNRVLTLLFIGFILFVSLIVAFNAYSRWDLVLRYFYQRPFGLADPIFSKEIGFYVFSLPFYLFVQRWFLGFLILAFLLTSWWYLKNAALQISVESTQAENLPVSLPKIGIAERARRHLAFLGALIVLLLAWGYLLKIYELLYSTQGSAFGASYTDVHIQALVYKGLIFVSLAWALAFLVNVFKKRTKLIWVGGGIWIGAVLLFANIFPAVVQKFVVKPNELAKESPYIAYNIQFTRKAYNLEKIREVDFPVSDNLTLEDIKKNKTTIQNIKIWDERPLLQTYKQIQSIRLYYDFRNVDVDRYLIDKEYRQVLLSARELIVAQLPPQANTWLNRHLIYTHGYGLAVSPVNQVTSEGLPRLFVKDLPPSFDADLAVERPEIYYGEKTDEYVLVKTKTKEFDYPKGDKNVYTLYQGAGGVPIHTFGRRALFALAFRDPQIFFTNYLSPESRILYYRRIDKRLQLIAPFLDYDADPYLVIAGGKLYWIQDAYTTSNMYPYSSRSKISYPRFRGRELNYIRNSVKVVIDAYNGDVSLYLLDEEDPIAKTYSAIFPGLFKPVNQMPSGLKEHIRYPRDLFQVQAETYKTYHMTDVQVFYNQEDLWQIPNELYGDNRQKMEAYYVILRLPEEDKEEFLLMLPFTPSKKDNMIGWLAARSDFSNYGSLFVYKLPKEKLVFGPSQIEARVDQQTEISREFTLWGQRGSRVIRGNLLAIPIHRSFIYVEPVYLEAAQQGEREAPPVESPFGRAQRRQTSFNPEPQKPTSTALPELKRVIVAFSNRLVMEENLDGALNSIFGGATSLREASASIPQTRTSATSPLAESALDHYNKALGYLREGRWGEYGKELEALEKLLKEMAKGTK